MEGHFKDEILSKLAEKVNVAQFVSFDANLKQRFSRVRNLIPNHVFSSLQESITALFEASIENELNIRSFDPFNAKGWPLIRGLKTVEETVEKAKELTGRNLHIIIHEEISDDNKTSGVLLGNVIEFAPLTTPRCVEANEVAKYGPPASLPKNVGIKILEKVYGFRIDLDFPSNYRVEFSILPKPYGHLKKNVMVWELEDVGRIDSKPTWDWPNRFSKYVGDKTFGLLLADAIGLKVPHTKVIGRNSVFNFGRQTSSSMVWTRTCPAVQTPGKFPTFRGYSDIFKLLSESDPNHDLISSVLVQDEVPAVYSGAMHKASELHIEGVKGLGDDFMLGKKSPEQLPDSLKEKLYSMYNFTEGIIGPVRFEWVFDGSDVWVVQMHKGLAESHSDVIVEGSSEKFERYILNPDDLESFRKRVELAKSEGTGLEVVGNFGLTSHVGDILRKAGVPSKRSRP